MIKSELIYDDYIAAWDQTLAGWLGWSEGRLARWVHSWEFRIGQNVHGYRDWFYHEDELHYVLPLLVPDDLADRLRGRRSRPGPDDLGRLRDQQLRPAIGPCCRGPKFGASVADWELARQQVVTILGGRGARLPGSSAVTRYESRLLELSPSDDS